MPPALEGTDRRAAETQPLSGPKLRREGMGQLASLAACSLGHEYVFRGRDAPPQECTPEGSSLSDQAAATCVAEFRYPAAVMASPRLGGEQSRPAPGMSRHRGPVAAESDGNFLNGFACAEAEISEYGMLAVFSFIGWWKNQPSRAGRPDATVACAGQAGIDAITRRETSR